MQKTVALPRLLRLDIDDTALNLTGEQETKILDVLPLRASYMRAFAEGRHRVSGADLSGKASKYGGRYAASRGRVMCHVESLGIQLVEVRGRHNAKSLWSWDALLVFLGRRERQFSPKEVRALVTHMNQASPATRQARAITLAQHGGAALLTQLVGAGLQIGPGPDA